MKRIMPAPMGRAFRIRKRSNHLTIIVSDGEASDLTNEKL
jgi:large subunit ribosomal protein L22